MKVVERIREFDAKQLDGSESCARDIMQWAYPPMSKYMRYALDDKTIKWVNAGSGKSYFTLTIAIKRGNDPLEEWQPEVGDWIVKDDAYQLTVYSKEAFEKKFKEVE